MAWKSDYWILEVQTASHDVWHVIAMQPRLRAKSWAKCLRRSGCNVIGPIRHVPWMDIHPLLSPSRNNPLLAGAQERGDDISGHRRGS